MAEALLRRVLSRLGDSLYAVVTEQRGLMIKRLTEALFALNHDNSAVVAECETKGAVQNVARPGVCLTMGKGAQMRPKEAV
jgi:hypothetical protein